MADSANSWQASLIFSYNSLSVWNLLSDAIPLVHDLTHDQGNIATFRTHITFEFQRTHIEFAWRSTFTYMFLLLAQISNFNLMLYFSQITFSHEKLRNWEFFYLFMRFLRFLMRISHFLITWEKKVIETFIFLYLNWYKITYTGTYWCNLILLDISFQVF